jgi:competence protein ComEC
MKRLLLLLALLPVATRAAATLDIYWIDVEGGASTLIVTPAGQSVLMDTGYAGFDDRDARRVERVVKQEAGLSRIDYLLISHFHPDHAGGLAALAKRVEIGRFFDHGESVDKDTKDGKPLWESYLKIAGHHRQTLKPGDRLPLKDVELVIVAADGRLLDHALPGGGANLQCSSFERKPEDRSENGRSLGYLFRSGAFEFVNLGDLAWNLQYELACPVNVLGKVDLYQVTHHGSGDDPAPQQMWALDPTVAVMNNGPTKGAGPVGVETVLNSPDLEDLWQLHRAVNNDDEHNTEDRLTANPGGTEGCEGNWIHARVQSDGSYTLTNSRNGYSKTYRVR